MYKYHKDGYNKKVESSPSNRIFVSQNNPKRILHEPREGTALSSPYYPSTLTPAVHPDYSNVSDSAVMGPSEAIKNNSTGSGY